MCPTLLLADAHRVVIGFRETVLVDEVHGVAVVHARHQLILLLGIERHWAHGLGHVGAVGIEGLSRRIIFDLPSD